MKETENRRYRSMWLIGMLFLFIATLSAQNGRYIFSDFTVKNGLSHANVLSIYEDKMGSYWIGTADGLTCILGNEIKNYTHRYADSTSILSNRIEFVVEDTCGKMWVSTSQGVSNYITNTDTFVPVLVDGKTLHAYSYQLVDGQIQFGGNNVIYQYSCKEEKVQPLLRLQSDIPLSVNYFKQVDASRFIIVDKYRGVFWADARTGQVSCFSVAHQKTEYNSYWVDSEGRLWLAPYQQGLECYSLQDEGKLLYHYTTDNSLLSHNSVTDIKEFGNELWIATDGGGINILDGSARIIQHIKRSPYNEHSISTDFIRVLFEDSFGTKWVGTVRDGLIRIREGFMKHYSNLGDSKLSANGYRSVSSICEDQSGNIWMGIEHSGLSKYDVKEKRIIHFPYTFSGSVMSIVDFDAHYLLVSFYGEGIYKCHKTTGALTRFVLANPTVDAQMCRSSIGIRMHRSPDRTIHFYGCRFMRYSLDTHRFEEARFIDDIHPNSLQVIASDEKITVVNDNQAIYQIEHADFSVRVLYADCRNELKTVTACGDKFFFYDGEGVKIFEHGQVSLSDLVLPYDKKLDVLFCDENGYLWLVYNEMVICHVVKNNENYIFTEDDGFQPNCFLPYVKLSGSNGYLYFGGNDGVLQVDKQWFIRKPSMSQPQLFLLAAFVGEQRLAMENQNGWPMVTLPWNHSSIKFQVHAKKREVFHAQEIKYIISGKDSHSEVFSNNNRLILPTLPSGEYSIRAACLLKDGTWTDPQPMVQLSILPPWWKTNVFLFLLFSVMLGIVSGILYLIIQSKKRKVLGLLHIEKGKLAEEKVNFLIYLSHELKTPLSLVYAPLKKLASELTDDAMQKSIAKVLIQVDNMSQLINVILDVRKMEMGATQLRITPVNLNSWVQLVAEDFRDEFDLKNISLKYELDSSVQHINFDADKCKIVLSNFLMNALKYSDQTGTVLVKTALATDGTMVRVSVADEGIGLKDMDTSKLFTSFYQGSHSVKGSGLGLAYSKLLMDLQHGSIGFQEHDEQGATFYFELPLDLVCETKECERGNYLNSLTDETYEDAMDSVEDTSFDFDHYTLLVVDDSADFLDYIKDSLKSYFKKIYTANSAEQALKLIRNNHPDLVVSDVNMPGKDGFILCHEIKSDIEISHIPVVLLTVANEKEDRMIGYKMGADAYLAKPFEVYMLLTILKNLFRTRESIKRHLQELNVMDMPKLCTFSNTDEQLLIRLNEFIKERLDNPQLDIDMMSKHMCMSHSSLYTKVKNLTGYSLNDYLMQLRMKKAKEYLMSTDEKIAEIATLVGFSDCRYFSTVFKKYEGLTPSKFKGQFPEKHSINH